MTDAAMFFQMLDRYNGADEVERAAIEREITSMFQVAKAVVAVDMSGFTRTVQEFGVVHYMGVIRRMNEISRRVIGDGKGEIAKTDADNLTAVFGDVETALATTLDLFEAFDTDNEGYEPSRRIRASAGIAWGDILAVPGYDVNGDAVNLSYKLGEDMAKVGQILMEEAAYQQLAAERQAQFTESDYRVSDVTIDAYRWVGGSG